MKVSTKPNAKANTGTHVIVGVSILICEDCHYKVPQPGWHKKSLFSHDSGGWESKIKASAQLTSPEASPLGLYMASSPHVLHNCLPFVSRSPFLIRTPVILH
jgi:hypothetical protein